MTRSSSRQWMVIAGLALACAGCSGVPATPAGLPPRTTKAPASEVVLRAVDGKDLSAPAAGAVRTAYNALSTANTEKIESLYRPEAGAPSQKKVAEELKSTEARSAVAEALRTPPSLEPDGDAVYSYGNYGVVVTTTGGITYIGNPR